MGKVIMYLSDEPININTTKNIMDKNTGPNLLSRLINLFKSPSFLLKLLVAVLVVFTIFKSADYGLVWDSFAQDQYGARTLHFYLSAGKNKSFMDLGNVAQHGPFVEVVENAAKRIAPNNGWYIRNVVTGLLGIVGVVAVYLCCAELGFPWIGLVAALILLLMPRFFGDMFINSKDIPFASLMALALYSTLRLINRWDKSYIKESVILALILAITNAVRITSIAVYVYLAFIVLLFWIINLKKLNDKSFIKSNLKKQLISGTIVVLLSYVVTVLLWPYVMLSPIKNLILSIEVMSKFPWDGYQLFAGQYIKATQFPRSYVPVWILISTPIITLVLFLIGNVLYITNDLKIKKEVYGIGVIILYFFFLLIGLVALKPNLSDAIRQVLFLLPPLAIIAAYGLGKLYLLLFKNRKIFAYVLMFIVAVLYGQVAYTMIDLHPYEQVYFNEFVGGLPGAYQKYETDYYGDCLMDANKWLATNYTFYTKSKNPIIVGQGDPEQYIIYLPSTFTFTYTGKGNFYMVLSPSKYNNPFPNTRIIYTVGKYGVPFCQVRDSES